MVSSSPQSSHSNAPNQPLPSDIILGTYDSPPKRQGRGREKQEDRLLPSANVGRIMKSHLPENVKISREARYSVQECVTEFIGLITTEAVDRLQQDRRKTITGDDVLSSIRALGFSDYETPLQTFYRLFRHATRGDKVATKRGRKKASEKEKEADKEREQDNQTQPVYLPHNNPTIIDPNTVNTKPIKRRKKNHDRWKSIFFTNSAEEGISE